MSKDFEEGFFLGMMMNDDGKDGCYIATSVYGSYDCPEVWVLRRFRDDYLKQSVFGRAFVNCYYAVSPTLVKWFGGIKWIKYMTRVPLDRLIAHLQKNGVLDTPYEDGPNIWSANKKMP